MDRSASCPFTKGVCKSTAGNLVLDTQFFDNYERLGVNRGPRFLMRRRMHCAPLQTKGFTEYQTDPITSRVTVRYKYGSLRKGVPFLHEVDVDNEVLEESWNRGYGIGGYRVR